MNIFGESRTYEIEQKVQNQTGSIGLTDFTGNLTENGLDVVTSADVGAYLPLAGGTMTGSIALGTNNLTNIGTLSGATNSRTADNIVSNAGTATAGRVATFASDKVIQDSGTLLTDLATNSSVASTYLAKSGGAMTGDLTSSAHIQASEFSMVELKAPPAAQASYGVIYGDFTSSSLHYLTTGGGDKTVTTGGPYLLLAGGTMTGAINMGGQEVNTVAAIRMIDDNVVLGTTAEAKSTGNVAIGVLATTNTVGNIAVGAEASAIGDNAICIGRQSSAVGVHAHCFGSGISNSTAGSILIDSDANFRSNTTTCDLGTTAKPFKNVYSNGSFIGSGTTDSSSVSTGAINTAGGLGVAKAINCGTTISCVTLNQTTPSCFESYYSGGSGNISFTASTWRLLDFGGTFVQVANPNSDFTFNATTGQITYTGTRTKWFSVSCSWSVIPWGAGFEWMLAKNGSMSSTSSIYLTFSATGNAGYLPLNITRVMQLATGNTVQLAGKSNTTATYQHTIMTYSIHQI